MMINVQVVLVLAFYHFIQVNAQEPTDYCVNENFVAKCPYGEVLVISSAEYGFMGIGRCATYDTGVNCTIDVRHLLSTECSWKRDCAYSLLYLDTLDPCLKQIRPYLSVAYSCVAVERSIECRSGSTVKVSGIEGSLSSAIAKQTGCGSLYTPWRIEAQKGLTVKISAKTHGLPIGTNYAEHQCHPLGFITKIATKENTTICQQTDTEIEYYESQNEGVDVQLITDNSYSADDFMLEFKVTGCVDLLTPEFAWYERSGDDAIIGCKHRNMTWHLHCERNRWNGVMGKCHDKVGAKTTAITTVLSKPESHQFLILVCIVAAVFITLLVCITVAIFKLIDRRNAKQLAKQQILLDTSTSHRYSGGPQRHDPLMYHERIEMVPDILENSLRRTYAPGKADSESSSQTNYPGTLYFMGTLGHNVQSPVVEAIPLPRKPASVSDSESEHLYDSIPADCT